MGKNNKKTRKTRLCLASHCLVLFIFTLLLTPAVAQVRFGVKGGFQVAEVQFSDKVFDKTNRNGFYAGPILKIGLPVTGLGVDVAALYDQRDLKIDNEKFRQQSLVLQGDFRCGFGIGDLLNFFLKLGPQFSFNLGDDVKHWYGSKGELNQFSLQETMLSGNLGAGVSFAKHFEATINYNIPISKTADFTWQQLGNQFVDQVWRHSKTRTNTWSVAACFYF